MPSPKFVVRNASNNVVFHSDDAVFGCIAGIFEVAAGSTPTVTYPGFPGTEAVVLDANTLFSDVYGAFAVDYALGYPRVVFASRGYDRQIAVFVR